MLVKAFINAVEGDVNIHIGYGHHACASAADMGIGEHPFHIGHQDGPAARLDGAIR